MVEGEDTADEKGPRDGLGSRSAADTDRATGFTLFDEVHELGLQASDYGAEGMVHVDGDYDVDQSGKTAYFDVVVEDGHLRCWLSVRK